MRVTGSELFEVEGALRHSVATARAHVPRRRGVALALRDEDGRVGLGEGSPLPGYSPDDFDACVAALKDVHTRIDGVADDIARGLSGEALVEIALLPARAALARTPSAAFAVETALLDLFAQRRGVSVAALLAGRSALAPVAVSTLLHAPVDDPDALVAAARAATARGISTVKVKVGAHSFAVEWDAVAALRHALGHGVRIRLDANGAWSGDDAIERLSALRELDVELVEEPMSGEALLSLPHTATPWAVDESLQRAGYAERLLALGACSAFVLKPALLGMLRAWRLAARASDVGVGVIVTHLLDGPIALVAARQLALALAVGTGGARPTLLPCGVDGHPGLGAWPSLLWIGLLGEAGVRYARDGVVAPSSAPGLGFGNAAFDLLRELSKGRS